MIVSDLIAILRAPSDAPWDEASVPEWAPDWHNEPRSDNGLHPDTAAWWQELAEADWR